MKLTPITAIFGGNASGKTNFYKAIRFARDFIVNTVEAYNDTIKIKRFLLDDNSKTKPSVFKFEILVNETVYEFSFSILNNAVVEEKLIEITQYKEVTLYIRNENGLSFDKSIDRNQTSLYNLISASLPKHRLFLNHANILGIPGFQHVYDWFYELELIAPDTRFRNYSLFGTTAIDIIGKLLSKLDTGITKLSRDLIPFEKLGIPDEIKEDIEKNIKKFTTITLIDRDKNNISFMTLGEDGNLQAESLMTYHQKINTNEEIAFGIEKESDGTKRLIYLLPTLIRLSDTKSKKVVIIDEMDRSLHTHLTKSLLVSYLETCSIDTRSQLIFTTHDTMLLNKDLLRTDEIWRVERNYNGVSTMLPFSAYKGSNKDKNIRDSYLEGRLGGTPNATSLLDLKPN